MKKFKIIAYLFGIILLNVSVNFAQITLKDSMSISPNKPSVDNKINLALFRSQNCCCTDYTKSYKVIQDSNKIVLSHMANTMACMLCDCLLPGSVVNYELDPLPKGDYEIFLSETVCGREPCPRQDITPKKIGNVTVADNIYQLNRNNILCLFDPCRYFSAINEENKSVQTISAIKTLDGGYVCAFCLPFIDWLDGDVAVRGHFEIDSLEFWQSKDTIFVVTEILRGTHVVKDLSTLSKAHFNLIDNGIELKIGNELLGSTLNLFDARGNLQGRQPLSNSSLFIPYDKKYSGMLIIEVEGNPNFRSLKIPISP